MMQILSHRGYWLDKAEKNGEVAFRRSFAAGFGTETDVRDCAGKLVIAHDPPQGAELLLSKFLEIYREYGGCMPLALNIKADGLQQMIRHLLADTNASNIFFFDMSTPDMTSYLRFGMPVFTRHSDVEAMPVFYEESNGVWLDAFSGNWDSTLAIEKHLAVKNHVCVVSAELHGRDHLSQWKSLRQSGMCNDSRLMICTDYPQEAQDFFS